MKKIRGVVTVEFAIVGAALMMVLFGCLEFGRATYAFAALNEGTRRAARLAAVCPINDPMIGPAANFLGVNGFSASNVTLSYLDANGISLGTAPASSDVYYVQVVVAGSIPLAIPFLSPTLSPSFTVTLPAESLGITIAPDGSGVLTPCS
jgi:Flp pilus assembly protein TadG